MDLDFSPPNSRIEISDIFRLIAEPDRIPWKSFQNGVDIHRLYGDGIQGPTAALLHFHPGGKIPLHEHAGFEHILVLSGSQNDGIRTAGAGTFIVNQPGTRHSILSENGCIVLAIYEKPVRFIAES